MLFHAIQDEAESVCAALLDEEEEPDDEDDEDTEEVVVAVVEDDEHEAPVLTENWVESMKCQQAWIWRMDVSLPHGAIARGRFRAWRRG